MGWRGCRTTRGSGSGVTADPTPRAGAWSTGCSAPSGPLDNPALDAAVEAGNRLRLPVVVFFAPVPFYPGGNLRHYTFLAQGVGGHRPPRGSQGRRFRFPPVSAPFPGPVLRRGPARPGGGGRESPARDRRVAADRGRTAARSPLDGRRGRDRSGAAPRKGTVRRTHHPPEDPPPARPFPGPAIQPGRRNALAR